MDAPAALRVIIWPYVASLGLTYHRRALHIVIGALCIVVGSYLWLIGLTCPRWALSHRRWALCDVVGDLAWFTCWHWKRGGQWGSGMAHFCDTPRGPPISWVPPCVSHFSSP